jgi:multiple sugar transport system permease protein
MSSWRRRQAVMAYGLLSIPIIYFTVYFFYPIIIELWASFYSGQPLIGAADFAGLSNYIRAFSDPQARQAFVTTLIYAIGTTVLTIVPALGLAAILSGPIRGAKLVRTIIFFPYIISFVIVALMWKSLLDPYTGILNNVLFALGLPGQNWLSDPNTALLTMILITVWKDIGYATLIYIAAIQGIPPSLYEAASLDGAVPRQTFFAITLPLLAPTTLFLAVVSMITQLQDISASLLLTNGGPADATRVFALQVYETAFRYLDIGYGSALSFLMFIVILLVTLIQFKLLDRRVEY